MIALSGVKTGALQDLTADGAKKIPDPRQTYPQIHYRSYCTVGRPAGSGLMSALASFISPPKKTCAAFIPTHDYIQAVTDEENDGLVPLSSAQYFDVQQPFWQCDHADAVGWNLDDPLIPQFNHFAAYDAIISQLENDPP